MAINLTDGAIAILSSGEAQGTDVKPVLQVADIRLVNTQHQSNNERYRILLSDGLHLQQGMLATQKNDLVRSQKLQKGSVVQLTQFVCNIIQKRMIIIIIDLDVILEKCDPIGEPKQYDRPDSNSSPAPVARSAPVQSYLDQPGTVAGNPPSYTGGSLAGGSITKPNVAGGTLPLNPKIEHGAGSHSYDNSFANNSESGRYNAINNSAGISRPPLNNSYVRPQVGYQQPPPMYTNRGPVAKNEAPARIIPIAALNPYQGRWTIKARVTAKGDLRHYNNPRGDGKVFSFDLLDSDGGEIRVTCFNAVADQFYNQIEHGKVYLISKGSLKPAQKAFNHLRNDHEIFLESTSTVQPCFEDDKSIPQQQFHFRPISDVEGMENNNVVDVIGVVSFVGPTSSIMRKNGTETQRRVLQLKDMSGRSVELTLWGNFCNAEGLTLQNMCDSGVFPVLAVKSGRVSDFNGKAVGTIFTSQLFIEPDFPEAHRLKEWFEKEGKNTPAVSISRETTNMGRTDVRKTISQIKDEKLGTSEKPDWITVSATLSFIKVDNFCYTACPIMIGDRQCNKKVTNNGDGKWRCDRCDQLVDECDYRYILQFQIQDHTGLTWVSAFQESGEEVMGISAKDMYYMKYEEQDDERFGEIVRKVLFNKYIFKLKVKEETFSDEQRVKSTVVKAEKVNFSSESRFLLDLMDKLKVDSSSSLGPKADNIIPSTGLNSTGYVNAGIRQSASPVVNYMGSNANKETGLPANQVGQYGNQYGSSRPTASGSTGMYLSCNSCGATGHSSTNCPSVMSGQGQSYRGGFVNNASAGAGASGECYKCHQIGHWARDCPGLSSAPPAYGSGNGAGAVGNSNECYNCHQFGHWAKDCPGVSNAPPAYGSGSSVTPGRYGGVPKQRVGGF
ncbi:replication protein A 70 kDa DNA-binding subunit A-like [Cornus florida]|uniref:replication protein A 70 kDa DNA-binding subunit A-like n=1 Tax=Cornus florida TaxID=4283 RepID=UPI00289745C9|nr:replication protein A 70 kDa DNA-binding subunit A-like [Cornus florida]